MKKIGEGFYYKVYDLGNGRVRKTQTSLPSRIAKLIAWGRVEGLLPKDASDKKGIRQKFNESLQKSKALLDKLPTHIMGNPVFLNEFEYEQDKATTLIEYIPVSSDGQFIEFVKKYCDLQKLLWAYGYSDTVFNFTINTAIDEKTNELILIDFNELTESKEKVISDIEKQKWNKQMSLRDFPNKELKKKISDLFAQEFTIANLEQLWKTKN